MRRYSLDGVEAKNAAAFSITKGTLCTEPVPFFFDVRGQTTLPDAVFTHYVGVRELHFEGSSERSLGTLPRTSNASQYLIALCVR